MSGGRGDIGRVLGGIEAANYPVGVRSATITVQIPEDELTADFMERMQLRAPSGVYVPLADIVSRLYAAKVGALSLELANPRHQHEHAVLKANPLPDSMVLIPGVIDSTVNYLEHPQVVCNRILQAVDAVGDRSRVIAGSDGGFGTFAGWELIAPSVAWRKFDVLAEGARLASQHLWG